MKQLIVLSEILMQILQNGFTMKTVEHHGDTGIVHMLIDMKHVTNCRINTHWSINQHMFFISNQGFFNTGIYTVVKLKHKHL